MSLAFGRVVGRADACDAIVFGGMTDRAIVRSGLTAVGREVSDAAIEAVIRAYLEILAEELPKATGYRVLPGAAELVELASSLELAVGLGTGNVRAGAQMKLERAGLWSSFEFGGFGCDAEPRDELIGIARDRGLSRLSRDQAPTLVIGDTPRDVAAAHAVGARCLAVATGKFSAQALMDAGAEVVVESLEEPVARAEIQRLSAA